MITDAMVERFAASYFPRGKTYSPDLVRAALQAAIGDRVLVPREPTDSMVRAGNNEGFWGYYESSQTPSQEGDAESVYRAMLAASQPPDAGEGKW